VEVVWTGESWSGAILKICAGSRYELPKPELVRAGPLHLLAGAVRPIRFNPKPQRRGGFKKRLKTSGRYLGLVSEYSYFFHPFPISACSAVLDLWNWFAFNSDNLAMRNVRL
jgi:hypothetical protein